jgi:phage host-nuclease inhibitor protein Gam
MSKKEIDFDEEINRLARKSNLNMRNVEYSYENQLKKLDAEIDNVMDKRLKEFDENKELTSQYLSIDYSHDTIDRYREKLRKI